MFPFPAINKRPRFILPYSCYLNGTDWLGSYTPAGSSGHRRCNISLWLFTESLAATQYICSAVNNGTVDFDDFYINVNGALRCRSRTASVYEVDMATVDGAISLNTWHHIHLQTDSTAASAADRLRLWVDGVHVTWASTQRPVLEYPFWWNRSGSVHRIGQRASTGYFQGYMAQFQHITNNQGQTLADFGKFRGANWIPVKPWAGSWGTYGFQLLFANPASLGSDTSGNGINYAAQGTPTQSTFTPTRQ